MAQRISAVSLLVPDYDAGIAFYVGALGFTLIEDSDLGGGKRWVTVAPPGAGQTRLLLAQAADAEQQAAIGRQAGGRVFLFLETNDFAADHARMQEAGVHFLEQPRHEPYGVVAVFKDPFGNCWDLIQPR
jgi:catechol 2,3-dioxygenase-like lactoylglutathione lyase family enzyme